MNGSRQTVRSSVEPKLLKIIHTDATVIAMDSHLARTDRGRSGCYQRDPQRERCHKNGDGWGGCDDALLGLTAARVDHIKVIEREMKDWLVAHEYHSLEQLKGIEASDQRSSKRESGRHKFMEPNRDQDNRAAQRMRDLVAIVESSDDAIVGKTLEGTITSWNKGAERLFGYPAGEIIGQPIARLIPEERLEEETEILARLRRGERINHFETIRRRKDGTRVEVSVSVSPTLDESGRIVGAAKIARDISRRKKAEQELQRSQARFERVINSAMDAIISIDETQRVVLFNAAAEQMFGCPVAEAMGQALDRFIPPRFRPAHRAHVRGFGATGATRGATGAPLSPGGAAAGRAPASGAS